MNAKSFLAGAVFGGLVILSFAAAEDRTPSWEYKAQLHDLGAGTSNDTFYTKALNDQAKDGWEVLCSHRVDYRNVEIVLRRAK
jgi:hypothetical protein